MQILAVRSGNGRGIHYVEDKNKMEALLKRYEGTPHRVFRESEKKKAMEWAGLKVYDDEEEIEKPAMVANTATNFVEIVDDLRKAGYCYATIKMNNNASYNIWLDKVYFLKPRCTVKEIYEDKYGQLGFKFGAEYCDSTKEYIPFEEWWGKFMTLANEFSKKYPKYNIDYITGKVVEKGINRDIFSRGVFCVTEKPKFTQFGDMVKISAVFKSVDFRCDGSGEGVTRDMVININQIVNIIPKNDERDVSNDTCIKMIKKAIKDKVVDANGKYIRP